MRQFFLRMKGKSVYITQDSPLQLSVSLALPAHGIPPEKILCLLLVPVPQVTEHIFHEPQTSHVPSTANKVSYSFMNSKIQSHLLQYYLDRL